MVELDLPGLLRPRGRQSALPAPGARFGLARRIRGLAHMAHVSAFSLRASRYRAAPRPRQTGSSLAQPCCSRMLAKQLRCRSLPAPPLPQS